jgi:hypothetical protein
MMPDGPRRWNYGYQCNAGHDSRGSKLFSAPDIRRYAAALGQQAKPRPGVNVLLEGDGGGVVELTMAELRAALQTVNGEVVVYLGRRVRLLPSSAEEEQAVEQVARTYCATSDFPVQAAAMAPPGEGA